MTTTGKCRMSDLVDDILLFIFEHLTILDRIRIERVNRRWQKLARLSWRNVKSLRLVDLFEMDNEFITIRDCNKVLVSLLKRAGQHLLNLDLSETNSCSVLLDFDEKSCRSIGRYCANVVDLNLSHTCLTNCHLLLLAAQSDRIESLKLVQCFEYELKPDTGLGAIFANMKKLKYIDLSSNDTIDGCCFESIEEGATHLEAVLLNNCCKIVVKHLEILAERCHRLKRFELIGYPTNLTSVLIRIGSNLEHLNLNSYEGDSSAFVAFEKYHSLKYLDIGHSKLVVDQTLQYLSQHCPLLASLNLSGKFGSLTNRGFRKLAFCKHLTELDISWLANVDDRSLMTVAKNGSLISLHAHLGLGLTEEGLLKVVRMCPNFHFLDITSCYQLGLSFLERLSSYCNVNRTRVTVHVCTEQVGDVSLDHVNHTYFCASLVV